MSEKLKIPQGSNQKIEEIVKSYLDWIKCHPKSNFEDQLRKHLREHNVK